MEYGSDFSVDLGNLSPTKNSIERYLDGFNSLFFDSGRSAIKYLLQTIKSKKVILPDFLCDSILKCFDYSDISFYHVNSKMRIDDLEMIPWKTIDVFYLLHYFGCLQNADILEYIKAQKEKFGFTIIEDTTHSLFTSPATIGDYCICSLRKWFPIPDGGILYSSKSIPSDYYRRLPFHRSNRITGMVLKSLYLNGIIDCKPLFRSILVKEEELLDHQAEIRRISPVSEMILRCSDVNEVIMKRKDNYDCLHGFISDILPEPFQRTNKDEVPFTYVISTTRRDELRKFLIEKKIYCAVHWPCPESIKNESNWLSERMLSIPIDQRYVIADMKIIANSLRSFFCE